MAAPLSIERRDAVALVTLQRPEKRNALSIELRSELAEAFAALAHDERIACAVLTGAGSAFCSGMDTTQFGGDRANRERLVETSTAAFDAVRGFPKPVIAAVNGPAIAGGFALALLCDLRLAAETATFGFPELPRGIPPAYAAARSVLGPELAARLCLTGELLDAASALDAGVVGELCAADRLLERALELADVVANQPRGAVLETKRRILLDRDHAWGGLFAEEARAFREALLAG
ncbi:MAG TPA: enoyl-CoA hydratase/isomerase family protein [Solirubrobacteraceae bacterium]|nr:enoyl-CoA hydratase/isomerase family protein [Solirubrobacteraceae bacterium]